MDFIKTINDVYNNVIEDIKEFLDLVDEDKEATNFFEHIFNMIQKVLGILAK